MSTKELSRSELVAQAFECCVDCVSSYGPKTVPEVDRTNMIQAMRHYKSIALRDIALEAKE